MLEYKSFIKPLLGEEISRDRDRQLQDYMNSYKII